MSKVISNLISGGQIFIHQIRMFKQIANNALSASLLMAIICSSWLIRDRLYQINWHPAITYYQALVIYEFDQTLEELFPNEKVSTINVSEGSARPKLMQVDKIIKDQYFIRHGQSLISLLSSFGLYILYSTLGFSLLIILVWSKIGKLTKETNQISGSKVNSAAEIAWYLKRKGKASDIVIAGMPLVKDSETKHILITGSSGSGKTNYLHEILPQVRRRKEPALVIDLEGSMVSRYYRPDRDIIINPLDQRSYCWNFWAEAKKKEDLEAIAASLFSDSGRDMSEVGKIFANWANDFFIYCAQYLQKNTDFSCKELFRLIHIEDPQQLVKKLKGTPAATIMDFSNEKNVTAHNIRSTAMAYTKWLDLIDENVPKEKKLCFKDYFASLEEQGDRWIFVTCEAKHSKTLLPFISLLLDVAVSCLADQGEDLTRRFWFIADELASLNRLPALEVYIPRLRKYGGCVLAATQSFKQFYDKYGRNAGSIMLAQFNTNIVCRINDPDEAALIIKQAGNIEYTKKQKNISFGAHEHRDGESYTDQEKTKPLIDISDFKLLDTFEAYVLLPEPNIAIGKIKSKLQLVPKNLEKFFVPKLLLTDASLLPLEQKMKK